MTLAAASALALREQHAPSHHHMSESNWSLMCVSCTCRWALVQLLSVEQFMRVARDVCGMELESLDDAILQCRVVVDDDAIGFWRDGGMDMEDAPEVGQSVLLCGRNGEDLVWLQCRPAGEDSRDFEWWAKWRY